MLLARARTSKMLILLKSWDLTRRIKEKRSDLLVTIMPVNARCQPQRALEADETSIATRILLFFLLSSCEIPSFEGFEMTPLRKRYFSSLAIFFCYS
jgi:hypothetical protein